MNRVYIFLVICFMLVSCEPEQMEDIDLGPLPDSPEISLTVDPENPNRIIAEDISSGFFNRLWIADGASPSRSNKAIDTFFYVNAGTYNITLHGAKEGGSGTAFTSQDITIESDATIECGPSIALLTGDCGSEGKCWRFSSVAGAITVGPTYGSGEWFRSPANGLESVQVNSKWCFLFENFEFDFRNNGLTISPWNGYEAIPHDPTPGPWEYSEGTGMEGNDQIILTPGQFMGTWDSGHVLDVVVLTEDELVVRSRIVDQSGTPANEGWFEFYFVAD